jgi:chitodextrinase
MDATVSANRMSGEGMRLHIFALTVLAARSLSAQAPPVPAQYQDLYNTLNTQIAGFDTAVNAGWNGKPYPYLNAPQLQVASSDEYTLLLQPGYAEAVSTELEELQALGAKAVTVQILFPILYQPFYDYIGDPAQYQQFLTLYQQLAQKIHSRGMKLVVEASLFVPLVGTDISQFQTYLTTLSWTEYMNARAANALAVAQLIQPDYLSVLTESDTEESVSGQTNLNTVAGVTQLVQTILTTLQNAGVKNIQIGAGVGTWTKDYLQYVQALAGLPMDFVDMHIYPLNHSLFTNALTAANTIQAAGKQVGISECWDMKVRDSELGILDPTTIYSRDTFSFWEPVDTSFLQAIVNFANYKQLSFISPYWVHYLFAYLDYNTYGSLSPSTVLTDSYTAATNANLAGAFTPTGLAWESMNIPPDTTPPATPAAPTDSAIGTTTVSLQWVPDHDNVGVSAYNLYRDGALVTTTSLLLYDDSGLIPGQTYTYNLTAADASGNVSPMSAPLVVQTVACFNNLTGRGNPSGPGGPQVNLAWSAQTNATGYNVLRSSTSGGPYTLIGTTSVTGYRDGNDGLVAGDTYYYVVQPIQGTTEICQSDQAAIKIP